MVLLRLGRQLGLLLMLLSQICPEMDVWCFGGNLVSKKNKQRPLECLQVYSEPKILYYCHSNLN